MAQTVTFDDDLTFRTVGPNELALVALGALKFGMMTESSEEAIQVRRQIRQLYPVFRAEQFAILSTAFVKMPRTLSDAWWTMRDEIAAKAVA